MSFDGTEVKFLLDKLCVELGFCLPVDEQIKLCASPPTSVDSFTDAVFATEGMDPHADKHLRALVRQQVLRAFRQG